MPLDVMTPAVPGQIDIANRGLESNNSAVDLLTQSVLTPSGDRLSIPSRWMIQDTRCWRDVHKMSPYDFILHTYEGSHGYMDGSYLIPHLREIFYEERRSMCDYRNVFKGGVDSLIDPIFSGAINRKSSSPLYDAFIENCDNCGTSLHNTLQNAILHARLYDIAFIVMDNLPQELTFAKTEKETIDGRLMPYIYVKHPQETHRWHTTPWGALDRVTFRDHIEQERSEGSQLLVNVQYYREWDEQGWRMYHEIPDKDNPTMMKEIEDAHGTHGLGVLPVIPILDFADSKNLVNFPNPSFYSTVNLCFSLYNKESWILVQEIHQSFPILCTSGLDITQLLMSPVNFINVNADAKFPPQFIMPSQEGIKSLVENCERLKDEIRIEFNMHGVEARSHSVRQQSGISKEWDFRAKEVQLKNVAKATINLENSIVELFKKYTNTDFTYTCTYPSEFSPTQADDTIDRVLSVLKNMPPEPLERYSWEKITQSLILNDPEKLKAVMDEMEAYFKQQESLPPAEKKPAPAGGLSERSQTELELGGGQ